jgi:hypothetical protein
MDEINRLSFAGQIHILGILGDLTPEHFLSSIAVQNFGCIHRAGITYYRVRIDDLRFYFEFAGDGIFCRRVLPKHSFEDFCFRWGFGSDDGGKMEQSEQFWAYLEEAESAKIAAKHNEITQGNL